MILVGAYSSDTHENQQNIEHVTAPIIHPARTAPHGAIQTDPRAALNRGLQHQALQVLIILEKF